jgi:hypothetical protein
MKAVEQNCATGSDKNLLVQICRSVQRVGAPVYFPKYLILHGINAFKDPNPTMNALTSDFDATATWLRLQSNYLHCPNQNI